MAVEMPPKMVAGKTSRNKRRGTSQNALIAICKGSEGGYMSSIHRGLVQFYCVKPKHIAEEHSRLHSQAFSTSSLFASDRNSRWKRPGNKARGEGQERIYLPGS